jgi:hypothetical protein
MKRDTLREWQNGVPLLDAWYMCAEAREKQLFLELHSEGLHLEFVQSLKDELIDRLYAGQLYAFGVENRSDSGPTRIPAHYFLKTAKIDWDRDVVTALGKEFHNVRVQSEQADKASAETQHAYPRLADPDLGPILQAPPIDGSLASPGRPTKIGEIR